MSVCERVWQRKRERENVCIFVYKIVYVSLIELVCVRKCVCVCKRVC